MKKDNIKISKAKISDAQSIRKLENTVWNEDVVNKYDIAVFVRFGYVYIAKSSGKLVGAIVACSTNTQEVYVCDIVVSEKYRHHSIAFNLYKKLLAETKGMDVISFIELKNKATQNLHKKLGAKFVKKVKNIYGFENSERYFVRIKNR